MIEATDFRNSMSLLGSAVSIVTTEDEAGRYGFTASSVCSVTDTPPTLLVCMNKSARSYSKFIESKKLAVNVLGDQHEHLSRAFSSPMSASERFDQGVWSTSNEGSPVLEDALTSFDCQLEQAHEVGSHAIFVCSVVNIKQSAQQSGLIYFNRSYHQVGE